MTNTTSPKDSEFNYMTASTHPQSCTPRLGRGATNDTVTVVIPVRNESAHIECILSQITSQDFPANTLEVIVADGRSTDATKEIAKRFAQRFTYIKVIDNPKRLASAGRNVGVKNSSNDYIVIIDGHSTLNNNNYLKNIVNLFQSSGADCLGRPQPLTAALTFTQRAIALARTSWMGHNPSSLIFSEGNNYADPQSIAVAYRRSVLQQVGVFDEKFDACEDVELNHRLNSSGIACFFSETIRTEYVPRSTYHGLFRQMIRYGKGRIRLGRKYPSTFSIFTGAPLIIGVAFLTTPIALILSQAPLMPKIFAIAAYSFLIMMEVARICCSSTQDPRVILKIPAALLTIHLGIAIGIFKELIADPKKY